MMVSVGVLSTTEFVPGVIHMVGLVTVVLSEVGITDSGDPECSVTSARFGVHAALL